jgi:hypothetical protein
MTRLADLDARLDVMASIDGLDIGNIRSMAELAVRTVESVLAGESGAEKKRAAVDAIVSVVEQYDHLLPIIGQWLDIQIVDALQRWAIEQLVEWTWGAGVSKGWLSA